MLLFDTRTLPQHKVVYCIFVDASAVYIGEGKPEELVRTLASDFPPLLTIDAAKGPVGRTALRYIQIDQQLVTLLTVPPKMQPGGDRPTKISTNIENILIALLLWQTQNNAHAPVGIKTNKIQNKGDNKGGWIECDETLKRFFSLYEQLGCPVHKPWPSMPNIKPQNPTGAQQFAAVWSSLNTANPLTNGVTLNIGYCNINTPNTPHMSVDMKPTITASHY